MIVTKIKLFLAWCFLIFLVFSCQEDSTNKSDSNFILNNSSDLNAQSIDTLLQGKKLFKKSCSSCHKINSHFIAPPLNKALDKWGGDREGMYLYIRNWQEAEKKGYARAIEVQEYGPTVMNIYPNITDEELDAIFAYVMSFE
ncbi:MAG: cytochrome c [Saprospiraceae bacterium]|nr:cytochrome c [Saprospiraceae bacterium]